MQELNQNWSKHLVLPNISPKMTSCSSKHVEFTKRCSSLSTPKSPRPPRDPTDPAIPPPPLPGQAPPPPPTHTTAYRITPPRAKLRAKRSMVRPVRVCLVGLPTSDARRCAARA